MSIFSPKKTQGGALDKGHTFSDFWYKKKQTFLPDGVPKFRPREANKQWLSVVFVYKELFVDHIL